MPLSDSKSNVETATPPPGGVGAASDADAIAACQARLQGLLRQQELLAYGISHDLRAPLRSIDQFSALLQRHADAQLDDTGRGHLRRIREATARMGALIEALLEYSLVDRADLKLAPVDLSLQAELVAAELQEAAPDREAHVRVAPGLVAHGDEAHLRMLLRQLLRNAWQFSGPRVEVEVGGGREGDHLTLWVRDQGRGFDARYADKLFEPFQRLHGHDEGAGSGLGLAIASRIAARHGGRLRARTGDGAGSTFFVELPLPPDPHEAAR